jgi:hypothetical protein
MKAAKLLGWLALMVVGLVVAGMLAIWVLHVILGLLGYFIVGAIVVGVGGYLYHRAKRSLRLGTRSRRRIDAATQTHRTRNP